MTLTLIRAFDLLLMRTGNMLIVYGGSATCHWYRNTTPPPSHCHTDFYFCDSFCFPYPTCVISWSIQELRDISLFPRISMVIKYIMHLTKTRDLQCIPGLQASLNFPVRRIHCLGSMSIICMILKRTLNIHAGFGDEHV